MVPLGHAGITLALAVGFAYVLKKEWEPKMFLLAVVVGAWLPDIIDKPVGVLLGYAGGGRLIAHSLLFAVVVTLSLLPANQFLKSKYDKWTKIAPYVPFVVFGMWMHLVLDEMWNTTQTFLWPAYGWGFPTGEFDLLQALLHPVTLTGEILGSVVLVAFVVWQFRPKKVNSG